MFRPARALLAAGLTLAAAAAPAPASASQARNIGDFGAWQAYTYTEGHSKVCYASAAADKTAGGPKGRKPTYLAVTHRSGRANEVSLTAIWHFRRGSDAQVQVGSTQFAFFTRGESAWAKQDGADKTIIAALVRGREAVVRATPAKGRPVVDVIPLAGFTKALQAIDKACHVKR